MTAPPPVRRHGNGGLPAREWQETHLPTAWSDEEVGRHGARHETDDQPDAKMSQLRPLWRSLTPRSVLGCQHVGRQRRAVAESRAFGQRAEQPQAGGRPQEETGGMHRRVGQPFPPAVDGKAMRRRRRTVQKLRTGTWVAMGRLK